jgi:hypothetical protein
VRLDHTARVIANADHKRSGLQTHIAATERISLCVRMKN